MKLKDFVAETLKEIIDGVTEAQGYYSSKGASVNSPNIVYRMAEASQLMDQVSGQIAQMVEFDVAITAAEGTETKGGIGVFVGPIGLGSQGKSDASNTSVSRIKFSVPVLLPKG
jgi:hypothetical protein